MRYFWLLVSSLIALLSGSSATAALADQALVVGVNTYPNLPSASQLDGSVNDADAVAAKLRGLGFVVSELTDRRATRTGVLGALQEMQSGVKASERFAFYFAGHGDRTPKGEGVILPSDASPVNQTNYIGADELYKAVNAIPAASRTIILDSCFSGAMAKGLDLTGAHVKSRFYNFFGADDKSVDLIDPSGEDDPTPAIAQGGSVCYFLAASGAQSAYEKDFGGKTDGVFTHYLLQRLSGAAEPWSSVQSDVTASVLQETGESQGPVLSPAYASVSVFDGLGDGAASAPAHRAVQSIWQTFSEEHADASQVRLTIDPDVSTFNIGEKFRFTVNCPTSSGFLVLLELDTDGDLDLVYPGSRVAQDGVVSGSSVSLPRDPSEAYTVDKPGMERVEAIDFRSEADAQSLLSEFPDDDVISSINSAISKNIDITNSGAVPFYTSTLSFEVATVI